MTATYDLIGFTGQEIHAINTALGKLPLEVGFSTVTKILAQTKEQDEKRTAEAMKQEEADAEAKKIAEAKPQKTAQRKK